MDSNITIHIVEPGSTPIEPVVPNTGLFTSGIGGPEATILGITAAVIILAAVVAVLYYRNKKQGKFISLKHKKATTIGLASLAAVVSLGTVAGLLKLGASAIDAEALDEAEEVAEVTDGELTIELGNEPVFAWVKSTVTVTEDMPAGYTLKAYSANPTLSAEGTDKTISMVTIPEDGLENAGSLATSLTDNTWGLAVEQPESQADEIYFSLPATAEEAVTIATVEDMEAEGSDTTTVYYGVYVTPGLPYGTYTGANVSYEVEPHYVTNLTFNGNGSDGGTAMEGITLVAGDTITLPENTFTKEGFSFTEWNTQADGEGKAYADEAEFTAAEGVTEDITLYAQWEEDLPVISDLTEMQDFAKLSTAGKASVLASMTSGQQYQLKDNRDQTVYYIAKLADGHVWMTQNLDLDLSTETTLTPANTNITKDWKPANSTIAIQNTSFPGWEGSNTAPYSADPGDVYYYTSGNNNPDTPTDKATCEQAHQDGSCAHYHAGNYYNWSAAVASNDTSEYGDDDQYVNVDTSICPAGWRLPKNRNAESDTEGNEQDAMISSYDGIVGELHSDCGGTCMARDYLEGGFNAIRTAPLWLARSGGIIYSSLDITGSDGYYWSSTVGSSSSAYDLHFYSGNVDPVRSRSRLNGYSVRCVAQ